MKVLLGVGESEDSMRAVERTASRVAVTGDELTVGIVDPPDAEQSPEAVAETVREILSEEDVDAEIRHLDGDPGVRLVDVAESEGFDEIVLGGGQRSPMGKIKLGSTAEFVLLNSHVTVSLIR